MSTSFPNVGDASSPDAVVDRQRVAAEAAHHHIPRGTVSPATGGDSLDPSRGSALDALKAAVRNGHREVPVACGGCGFELMLVDARRREIGWDGVYVVEHVGHDPELGALIECPGCCDEVLPDTVVLRDQAIA